MKREELLTLSNNADFDALILGGGISGARIYSELCNKGYKVLLLDKGDFACGTSQASGMMIWGGLLYLKNLDFKTVRKLCKARDQMISSLPEFVESQNFRYMPCQTGGRNRLFVYWVLMLYWLMGSMKRSLPKGEADFSEFELLKEGQFKKSLLYEEAFLNLSDCRFVLHWLMSWQSDRTIPLNYCEVIEHNFRDREWHLSVQDHIGGKSFQCRSKYIINAAGVWTDKVNYEFEVESAYRHKFSKGVYLNLPRPEEHRSSLIFEMGQNGDSQSYVPWGPVSMWGPTETPVEHLQGSFYAEKKDLEFLLNMANKNLKKKYDLSDIVSVRAGVRPLAVKKNYSRKVYPLELSRKHMINKFNQKNFLSIYGGKLTSCGLIAEEVTKLISSHIKPCKNTQSHLELSDFISFPGIESPIPSPAWCRDNEACLTLEDYLRRRTNISQWIYNEGFGENWQNFKILKKISSEFTNDQNDFDRRVSSVKNNSLNSILEKS